MRHRRAVLVAVAVIALTWAVLDVPELLHQLDDVFIVGSLVWGMVFDGFRPDRYDISGALVCLVGVALIMNAPR